MKCWAFGANGSTGRAAGSRSWARATRSAPCRSVARSRRHFGIIPNGDVAGQDIFFLDQFGGQICARHFQLRLKSYGKAAKIEGVRVSPHTLRHTFATQYILNGGDAFSLQAMLGHSTLEMVKLYVRLANRDVALQHQRYSPIDKLGPLAGGKRAVRFR